ncbi:MAG: hypothetical protein EXR72_04000 [Myxococcales bacterium]|nr:hypothetical protein [Myxococcales bacterium]
MSSVAWQKIEDHSDLCEVSEILFALERALTRERAALQALDMDAMAALTEKKQALCDRLRALADRSEAGTAEVRSEDAAIVKLRGEVRLAALRIRVHAEANAALLEDATAAIGEALGLRQDSGTYDHRARVQSRVRAFCGKRA